MRQFQRHGTCHLVQPQGNVMAAMGLTNVAMALPSTLVGLHGTLMRYT